MSDIPTPVALTPAGADQPALTFTASLYLWTQTYDIQVSTTADFSGGFLWNVAAVPVRGPAKAPISIPYGGTPMTAGPAYYWRIRITAAGVLVSDWSAPKSFTFLASLTEPDVYGEWAGAILSRLGNGVGATGLGTLIPEGTEVAALVCADYRTLYQVIDSGHGDPIDRSRVAARLRLEPRRRQRLDRRPCHGGLRLDDRPHLVRQRTAVRGRSQFQLRQRPRVEWGAGLVNAARPGATTAVSHTILNFDAETGDSAASIRT